MMWFLTTLGINEWTFGYFSKKVEMHLTACNKRMENPKDQKLDIGCPYCPTVFQKKNVRLIHLMSHMDEGLTCMFCEDKISRTWKALKKHYDLKHAKQVKKLNSTKYV